MKINLLIKEILYKSDLNQKQLAEMLDITQTTISRIRNNKQTPKMGLARKIAILARKYKIKISLEDITFD